MDVFPAELRPPEIHVELLFRTMRLIFSLLGWRLSEEPEKNKPFANVFQALGVEFNLEQVPQGSFSVGNTSA